MTNITIGAGDIGDSTRLNHRSLAGIPYVIFDNVGNIQAHKGNSGEPTSFTEQDAVNAPDDALFIAVSTAIKKDGVIGVLWIDDDATTKTIQYAEFNTNTDTWGVAETVDTLTASSDIFIRRTSLAMDGNDIPHGTWPDATFGGGLNIVTAEYSNRIGGSWKARVTIQTGLDDENFAFHDMMIAEPTQAIGDDRPIIQLLHRNAAASAGVFDLHHGNALDATGFTDALNITTNAPEQNDSANLSIDDAGNIWILFTGEPLRNLRAIEHLASQSVWGTWETEEVIDTSEDYTNPCGTTVGRFVYVIALALLGGPNEEIRLFRREGTTWVQETADPDLPFQTTSVKDPRIKFGKHDKNPTSLDYIFEDGGNILYNQLTTVNPQAQKTKASPINISATI